MATARTSTGPSQTLLWGMTGTIGGLLALAAFMNSQPLTRLVLIVTGAYAIFGIGVGIRAGLVIARRYRSD